MPQVHYDPFAYQSHEDPFPTYQRLRDEAPAYYNDELNFWALSRYEDVKPALIDHQTYCSGKGFTLEDIDGVAPPMVLGMDPPDHTRVRATISRALTPRRIAELEDTARKTATEMLKRIAPVGKGDIITDLGARLPMSVIARMLRVPEEDQDRVRGWADDMVHRDDSYKGIPEKGRQAAGVLYNYFDELVRKRSSDRGDDLLSQLVEAGEKGEMSHEELVGFCFLLIIAGNETTTKLIGNMTYQLSLHPRQRERLISNPSLIANAVEETLRYDTSTHMMARTLTRDVQLHGQTMKEGQKVALLLASANRDGRHWQDPDTYDVSRDASDHVAFGFGIHHCLGAALARLESRVVLEEILARIPDFKVDAGGLERMHSGNVRGYSRVPISFTPRA